MAKGRGIKGKAEKVSEKDFQKQLQHLVDDLSEASDKLKGKAKKKGHKARNRVILLTGVTLGVLYNPWTGQATREWIMDRVAGGDGAGLEELEAELAAEADADVGRRRATAPEAVGSRRPGSAPRGSRSLRATSPERSLERAGHETARRGDVVGLEQDRTGRRQRRRLPGPVGT